MQISYRKCIWILIGCLALSAYAQEQEPEIIIELTGQPDAPTAQKGISIWDKDTRQLAKLLRGKTREEALYQITSVSTKDVPLQASDGTRYRFVQYGREGGYRKLLFRGKDPQTFIDGAATPQETLELCIRYQVNIDLSENEFLTTFAKYITPVLLPLDNGQTLYELARPKQEKRFLLFAKGHLLSLLTQQQADQLIQDQQVQKEKQEAAQMKPEPPRPPKPRKALLEGGTLYDQMFMPRVIKPADLQPAALDLPAEQTTGQTTP